MAAKDSASHDAGSREPSLPEADAAAGELPPFAAIYEQYFNFVWSSARRLGVAPAAMDDTVQEIFIVVHRKLGTLRQPQSLRSWVYGIVRRTVSDHRRSQRAREASTGAMAVHPALDPSPPPTPQDLTEQSDEVRVLWTFLERLEPAQREVFVLAELEELTAPEIAEALGIPLNTAYSRLRAARQTFEAMVARQLARQRGEPP